MKMSKKGESNCIHIKLQARERESVCVGGGLENVWENQCACDSL